MCLNYREDERSRPNQTDQDGFWFTGIVEPGIVLKEIKTLCQHASSLILNGSAKVFQSLTIQSNSDGCFSWQKHYKKISFIDPENKCNFFSIRLLHFKLSLFGEQECLHSSDFFLESGIKWLAHVLSQNPLIWSLKKLLLWRHIGSKMFEKPQCVASLGSQ